MKKYELTDETILIGGQILRRIRALRDFDDVKAGDIGGYIENENNLSHEGNAWVSDKAYVSDKARVSGNARVIDKACVSGNVHVSGDAYVCENAKLSTNEDYTIIQGFGTECRSTTFYRCVDGKVRVKCGCFSGTIDEFRDQVKRTRTGKIAKEYLTIADLMEYHFEEET